MNTSCRAIKPANSSNASALAPTLLPSFFNAIFNSCLKINNGIDAFRHYARFQRRFDMLKNIENLYLKRQEGTIDAKREIISSIFPEKFGIKKIFPDLFS